MGQDSSFSSSAPGPRPVPVRFDPFADDPTMRSAYQLLLKGAWDEFSDALDSIDDSWLLQSILTSEDAAVEVIVFQRLADACPTAQSLALLGGAMVRDAWTDLENASVEANATSVHGWFEEQLRGAEEVLQQAVRARPALADPWVHLLTSGRGLGIDLQELRTRFENAHSRVPFRPDACREYVFALSSRGGGADQAMFDYARWLQIEAPPDSPARMALPMAHLEHGLGQETDLSLTEHLTVEETVAELTPALASFLLATPAEAKPAHLLALNAFALAMTVSSAETAKLTEECFHRIDNRPTSYPWRLYEDEEITDVFAEVQRTQLRSVARYD